MSREIACLRHEEVEASPEPLVSQRRNEVGSLCFEPPMELEKPAPFGHHGLSSGTVRVAGLKRAPNAVGSFLHGALNCDVDLVHEHVNVIEIAEHVLKLLRAFHDRLGFVEVRAKRLEQVPKPFAGDASFVEAFVVVEVRDLSEDQLKLVCVYFGEVARTSCEARHSLIGQQVLLTSHHSQPFLELIDQGPERRPKRFVEIVRAASSAFEEYPREPVQPCHVLRRKGAMLLLEPLQGHLGLATGACRALDRPKPPAVLGTNGLGKLDLVRTKHASKASNPDTKIMKCLAVETVVEPALGGAGGSERLQREPSRSLFAASPE